MLERSGQSPPRSASWAPWRYSRASRHWFPTVESLPGVEDRLAYPVNYWNGLASLIAIGIPLILTIAAESRRALTQAVATASLR